MSDSEILVVQSKLKTYIKAKSGMSTSGAVAAKLSEIVRQLCDQAIATADSAKRKTVMDRDFDSGE
jgi:histone H3/H4